MLLAERRIQFVLDQAIDGDDKILYLIHDGDPSEMIPTCLVVQIKIGGGIAILEKSHTSRIDD